jgi:hypothetical protein
MRGVSALNGVPMKNTVGHHEVGLGSAKRSTEGALDSWGPSTCVMLRLACEENVSSRLSRMFDDDVGPLPRVYWFIWAGTLVNRLGSFVLPMLTIYLTGRRGLALEDAGAILSGFGLGSLVGWWNSFSDPPRGSRWAPPMSGGSLLSQPPRSECCPTSTGLR